MTSFTLKRQIREREARAPKAQILTPELYRKKAQDKIIAVVRGCNPDGSASLPAFYSSRNFFDLEDPSKYATEFEALIAGAWDKPLYVKPETRVQTHKMVGMRMALWFTASERKLR
ncbi:MAG: hypothetical protein JWL62_140 [Hyphomicrobiales bacterium]|nr:hypothetical protein [Hyphomicrobiales bacterium]